MITRTNDELLDGYQGIWSESRNLARDALEQTAMIPKETYD